MSRRNPSLTEMLQDESDMLVPQPLPLWKAGLIAAGVCAVVYALLTAALVMLDA